MDGLKLIPYVVLVICISGIIAGASAIALAEFGGTTTNLKAIGVIGNSTDGIVSIANQFPTVGIIGVMVVIISLIAGVFVYVRYFS